MRKLLIVGLVSLMVLSTMNIAVQESVYNVDIATDKQEYIGGEKVFISGTVTKNGLGYPKWVGILVKDQLKTPLYVTQKYPDRYGQFQSYFRLPINCKSGEYTVFVAVSGTSVMESVKFKVR